MRPGWLSRLPLTLVALLAIAASAFGQEMQLASRPRFLAVLPHSDKRVDASNAVVLRRRVSIDLDGATVGTLLKEIARQADLELLYSEAIVPVSRPVTLHAQGITVAAALTEVLLDTGLDVLVSPTGQMALVQKAADVIQDGTVSGRVTDAKSGKAIPNVSVFLEGTRWRASSGEDGAYRLTEVKAGTYTLTASRIGYTKQSQLVTVPAGQEVTVDLTLQAAATELEQVVVTGTVTPTERKAVPTPISVITGDEIERRGYLRVDQIFRGDIPGAVAWDLGPLQSNMSSVDIRGGTSLSGGDYVKTYIDGVEVADPSHIASIDPSTIDRIEVLRGPQGSTIYGSEALAGVLQIFTKRGDLGTDRARVEAKISAGLLQSQWSTTGQQDHSLMVTGGSSDFSYSLGGGYIHSGDWLPQSSVTKASLNGAFRGVQGPLTVELSARYYGNSQASPVNPAFQSYTFFSKPLNETDALQQQTYALNLKYAATPRWHHNLVLGYDVTGFDNHQNAPRFTTPSDTLLYAYVADWTKVSVAYNTTYEVPLTGTIHASLTGGVDHWRFHDGGFYVGNASTNTNTISSPNIGYRLQSDNSGYFAQTLVGLSDAAFLTAGIRAEDNQNFGKDFGLAWSPRVGVSYVFRTLGNITTKTRLAYGEAIRPPAAGLATAFVSQYYQQVANPTLAPEKQRGWDGGVDLYFGTAGSLEVTYYNQTALDLIAGVLTNASSTPTYQYQNLGRIGNDGWEFQGQLNVHQLSLTGTVSLTNSVVRQLSASYTGDLRVGDQLLHIPKHTAGATVSYNLPHTVATLGLTYIGSWTEYDYIALYGFYFGGQPYRGSGRDYWTTYPGFTKMTFSLSQSLSRSLSLFAQSDNLTNSHAVEHDNSVVNRGRLTMIGLRERF
jgi:outer membrane receptor protein involved in Fe transport